MQGSQHLLSPCCLQGAMLANVPTSHEGDMFLYVKLSKNLKKQRMAKLDHLARNVNLHLFPKHACYFILKVLRQDCPYQIFTRGQSSCLQQ